MKWVTWVFGISVCSTLSVERADGVPQGVVSDRAYSIFDFGSPEIFVTTNSQNYDLDKLINRFTRTYLLDEYLIHASSNVGVELYIIIYDRETSDDVVTQNLRQKTFFSFMNVTGALPTLTFLNTTFKDSKDFVVKDHNGQKVYYNLYTKASISNMAVPAYDAVFEIPGNSFHFLVTKTAIDVQFWGLLRWQLSTNVFVTWDQIKAQVEALRPAYITDDVTNSSETETHWEALPSSFRRVDNPCLPDFFLMYIVVGDKESGIHHVYMDVPAFNLNDQLENFYNLTNSFCPHLNSETFEDCGFVQQLVLTNNHLVALTDKGIYVSASLNLSIVDVSGNETTKPIMSYNLIDPCANFAAHISCFKQGITSLASDLIHSIRLFYTPVCHIHQLPHFEDRLILVVEHTAAELTETEPPTRALSVLYSSTPYTEWHSLFIGKSTYDNLYIVQLIGIFFNHQLRHFDITLKLKEKESKTFDYRRFVLPDLNTAILSAKNITGYQSVNGTLGQGFLEKQFPGTFQMNAVKVNPGSMDVFFIGSQVWIAESGGSLVYKSIGGTSAENTVEDTITDCFFNHPDRTFVCVLTDKTKILVGKVASLYTPTFVDITTTKELWLAAGVLGGLWTMDYVENIVNQAFYTVSYGGQVLMWYLFELDELLELQKAEAATTCEVGEICQDHSAWCNRHAEVLAESCRRIKVVVDANRDDPVEYPRGAHFRMISIDPSKLIAINKPSAGPLVPFFVDAESTLLFEGKLPGQETQFQYFSQVNLGQKIVCQNPEYNPDASFEEKIKEPEFICDFYIQHSKPVDKFLDGFRLVLFASMLIPPRLIPFEHNVTVMQIGNSNRVLLKADAAYENIHVGQTHYFPQHFSVLIRGFPDSSDMEIAWGYSTVHTRSEHSKFTDHAAYSTFLIDLSTVVFNRELTKSTDVNWEDYTTGLQAQYEKQTDLQQKIMTVKEKIQNTYDSSLFKSAGKLPGDQIFRATKPLATVPFDPVAEIKARTGNSSGGGGPPSPTTGPPPDLKDPWTVIDARCHHILQLEPNSILQSHGGRVTLDLHDHLSFTVKLRPTSALGLTTLYRPLIVVTNSNPEVIQLEKRFIHDTTLDLQSLKVTVAPTGTKMGLASIIVRSIITSLECKTPSSMTFIIQAHRAEGRRLHVTYPEGLNWCWISPTLGGHRRPKWITQQPNCIPYSDVYNSFDSDGNYDANEAVKGKLLDVDDPDRDKDYHLRNGVRIMKKLDVNYRPPSVMGERIPTSENIYNGDPSKPQHNSWYHVSNESLKYKQCLFKKNRAGCGCKLSHRLSDDPKYSDCKELVIKADRTKAYKFSVVYDPIMRDEDQHEEFYHAKKELSVYVEEINRRTEFTIQNSTSRLVQTINMNSNLNEGRIFYDASGILITLHGTGLFHFRVGLGKFDTFEEVTSYFMLYSDSNELNHIKLAVVMLITITLCFVVIFFGFLRVRRRLSSQLPFQSTHASKFKLE